MHVTFVICGAVHYSISDLFQKKRHDEMNMSFSPKGGNGQDKGNMSNVPRNRYM